jgi:hypothetical protein
MLSSFLRSRGFTDAGSLLSSYLGSNPRRAADVQSNLNSSKHDEFNQTFRYASELPGNKVPSYVTVDARLGRRVGERFAFSIVGQNPLRPIQPEFGGDPGPLAGIERSILTSVMWAR